MEDSKEMGKCKIKKMNLKAITRVDERLCLRQRRRTKYRENWKDSGLFGIRS